MATCVWVFRKFSSGSRPAPTWAKRISALDTLGTTGYCWLAALVIYVRACSLNPRLWYACSDPRLVDRVRCRDDRHVGPETERSPLHTYPGRDRRGCTGLRDQRVDLVRHADVPASARSQQAAAHFPSFSRCCYTNRPRAVQEPRRTRKTSRSDQRWAADSFARVRTVIPTALRPSQRTATTTSRSAVRLALPSALLYHRAPGISKADTAGTSRGLVDAPHSFRLGHEPRLGFGQVSRGELAGVRRRSLPRHAT